MTNEQALKLINEHHLHIEYETTQTVDAAKLFNNPDNISDALDKSTLKTNLTLVTPEGFILASGGMKEIKEALQSRL